MTNIQRAEVLFFEGNNLLEIGDALGAQKCFESALKLAPEQANLYANLAFALEMQGEMIAAESAYLQAIMRNPTLVEIYLNFGALLVELKRFTEAEQTYLTALELDTNRAATWSNLGVLYASMRRDAEAEACYSQAIKLDPEYTKAQFNMSYILLRQGRFDEGWAYLEARSSYNKLATLITVPRWRGEELDGKHILLASEAGQGDVIQFCRYAAEVKKRGAGKITLLCYPALKKLLTSLAAVDCFIGFDEPLDLKEWDFWSPLLSLPAYCKTQLKSIPAQLPYLSADYQRIEHWASYLLYEGLRVGLVWKGNPNYENDADRSLPSLAIFSPLGEIKGVNFIGLQKGAGEDDPVPDGFSVLKLGSLIDDFADTAAILASLDLIISVDTAVAHLAGAMGKPCWVLLPHYKTDWRWLSERDDTPWYPEVMRLFHQPATGDWASVIQDVKLALLKSFDLDYQFVLATKPANATVDQLLIKP
jgi:Tfp pilus assembly protein PilF